MAVENMQRHAALDKIDSQKDSNMKVAVQNIMRPVDRKLTRICLFEVQACIFFTILEA